MGSLVSECWVPVATLLTKASTSSVALEAVVDTYHCNSIVTELIVAPAGILASKPKSPYSTDSVELVPGAVVA